MSKVNQLFYRGPSLEALHEEYAKQGRIDDQAFVMARQSARIEAPIERVWAVLSDVPAWPKTNPEIHNVQLDDGVIADGRFTWANGKSRIKSRFAVVDAERELTWTGVSSGAKAAHRNLVESTADGATRVISEESMAGPLLTLFYSSTKLEAGVERWLAALKRAAEDA